MGYQAVVHNVQAEPAHRPRVFPTSERPIGRVEGARFNAFWLSASLACVGLPAPWVVRLALLLDELVLDADLCVE